jgi:hypothetical protein
VTNLLMCWIVARILRVGALLLLLAVLQLSHGVRLLLLLADLRRGLRLRCRQLRRLPCRQAAVQRPAIERRPFAVEQKAVLCIVLRNKMSTASCPMHAAWCDDPLTQKQTSEGLLAFCFDLISSTKLGPLRVANSTSLVMRCSSPASCGAVTAGGGGCWGSKNWANVPIAI